MSCCKDHLIKSHCCPGTCSDAEDSPYEDLGWSARILVCQLFNRGIIHAHRSRKRRVRLDGDVVLGARLSNLRLGVEGVDFDLVDDWFHTRVRRHELFDLSSSVRNAGLKTVSDAAGIWDGLT